MLMEIKCDKFKVQPKSFNSGLNIIVGSDDGGNSIGKSTFLMILDFVLGGTDYLVKSVDVHNNVGEHDIYFAFKFNEKISYFCRNTIEKSIIYICDDTYNKISSISLEQYIDFLKNQYCLNYAGLSFRNEIGRYFRIYGRENLQEKKPLHLFHAEAEQKCIDSLLKLFDKYSKISDAMRRYDEKDKEKKAIDQANKYNLIKKIGATDYKNNVKVINDLKIRIANILKDVDEGLKDANSTITEETLRLKQELSKLRISRSRYIFERDKLCKCKSSKMTDEQYRQLKEFFPNINLDKIDEYENFHDSIKMILNEEIKQEIERYDLIIKELSLAISKVEEQIKERSSIQSLSKNILMQLTTLQKQEEELRKQNELFDNYKSVIQALADLRDYIKTIKCANLEEIETKINSSMERLNDYIYNGENKAPIIKLSDSNYRFSTPDDTGTGTSYKSMIVFDLSMLELTALPILMHDSYLLKQIQDTAIEKILELYVKSGKQVFISIDKVNSLTPKSIEIIETFKILSLYPNGGELFGCCWNKK